MRKLVAFLLVVTVLSLAVAASAKVTYEKDPIVSFLLSVGMPGTGEWYNNGWAGSFPWAECIFGKICCLVQASSVLDAVNGNTDQAVRLDFWTAPVSK